MKNTFVIIILLTLSVSVKAQDCKAIQTGKFRIAADSIEKSESILIRTRDLQIEDVPSRGIKLQFKLTWTSDCSYTLSNPKVLKGEFKVEKGQEVYVNITKVTTGYYTARISSNFFDAVLVKNIEIIK